MIKALSLKEADNVIGGGNEVLDACWNHDWHYTGNEREGWWFFFWTIHEKEQECSKCHAKRWIDED